jgi:5-methylcytosine-specific restriction endonuclease McrA
LVPVYRALTSDLEACCQSCGHQYDNERDSQIEHILPPRNLTDWARQHARNLRFLCTNCNRSKAAKNPDAWLDDEEAARLANEANQTPALFQIAAEVQLQLVLS